MTVFCTCTLLYAVVIMRYVCFDRLFRLKFNSSYQLRLIG